MTLLKCNRLVVRTHGGLGNQVFQIFFATCMCVKYGIESFIVIHDANYAHGFGLEKSFVKYCNSSLFEKFLSKLRLPKIFAKIGFCKSGRFRFLNTIYLDGYFQDKSFYSAYESTVMRGALLRIKSDLSLILNTLPKPDSVHHIRLKDFFGSEDEEARYISTYFANIDHVVDVVTNNDKLLLKTIHNMGKQVDCVNLIDTENEIALGVLRILSGYSTIVTNGSTLAFWAAVFYDRALITTDSSQSALYQFFKIHKVFEEVL